MEMMGKGVLVRFFFEGSVSISVDNSVSNGLVKNDGFLWFMVVEVCIDDFVFMSLNTRSA